MGDDSLGILTGAKRHDYILQKYILNRNAYKQSRKHKRDIDVIRENHKFLWEDDEVPNSWECQLAKKYYEKLFKEYCVADLSRFRENKIAMRWRTEQEVVCGKGQFQCGSRNCLLEEDLQSWEVNFRYLEQREKKNALVKLRLCTEHSNQLNYTSRKREVRRLDNSKAKTFKERKKINRKSCDIESKDNTDESEKKDEFNQSSSDFANGSCENDTNQEIENTNSESDIWSKNPDFEPKVTREQEFERYLEDLLL